MKLSIQGTEYEFWEAISEAPLGDLRLLNKRGVTVQSIRESFKKLDAVMLSGAPDAGLSLSADEQFVDNMIGVVFLVWRHAGIDASLEDAERVPFSQVFLTWDEEDQGEPDPKAG